MSKASQLKGMQFSRLLVLDRVENATDGSTQWLCQCDCGNIVKVIGKNLKNGHTQSCGCLQRERSIESNVAHGKTNTKIYCVWKTMRQRCFNSKHHKFRIYGARGITVCREWKNDFQAFYDYVSQLSHFGEEGYSIDRINNDGNYEPGNVRWATAKQQANNRRTRQKIQREYPELKGCEAVEAARAENEQAFREYAKGSV